ncbi:hypothetical protein PLESTF_001739300 [Pleodorina starrii]|nr:hypothetical protein PLESTF_001739300 [Pleodorina starrii]
MQAAPGVVLIDLARSGDVATAFIPAVSTTGSPITCNIRNAVEMIANMSRAPVVQLVSWNGHKLPQNGGEISVSVGSKAQRERLGGSHNVVSDSFEMQSNRVTWWGFGSARDVGPVNNESGRGHVEV